ncbi:hypothetical protein P8452_41670 [Trifolium repens]|nr:hypothetical protein P8452_41670 [Trifolium repens]
MERKFLKAAPSAARVVGSKNGFAFEGASLCVNFGQFKSRRAIKLQASPRTENIQLQTFNCNSIRNHS